MKEIRKLKANEIEVRVGGGSSLLLYKTSRVDMIILDEVFGPMNWTCDYKEVKGNMYCGIGIRENANEPFVWKWDCGTESNMEAEKGEASDSFKRAGFKVGIGRELYTAPRITYKSMDKYARYDVTEIEYDDNGNISNLVIVDDNGNVIYSMKKKTAVKKIASDSQNKTECNLITEDNITKCLSVLAMAKEKSITSKTILDRALQIEQYLRQNNRLQEAANLKHLIEIKKG